MKAPHNRKRILAVASGGGHWVQLLRLQPALANGQIVYVTVSEQYRCQVGDARFYAVRDATRWNKLRLLQMALQVFWIMLRVRPEVVISTGAAPGYFAIRFGRWFGARTIWVDSMANAERMSLSGQKVGRYVDLWLTQWQHLAQPDGPHYLGEVL